MKKTTESKIGFLIILLHFNIQIRIDRLRWSHGGGRAARSYSAKNYECSVKPNLQLAKKFVVFWAVSRNLLATEAAAGLKE